MHMSNQMTQTSTPLPLDGLVVIDMSQFLAGPSAALRLADLGAEVIKIERPDGGDISRRLYVSNLQIDGESTLFHAINRNKVSLAADLKSPEDLAKVKALVARADVVIQNFRPGVIERLGLGYDTIREINPRVIYASISGYGSTGPWRDKPGQDLLVQSMSGLPWMSGNDSAAPVATGVAVADMFTGAHLVQGVLAALVRRGVTGQGARIDVSLFESILDLQFEFLSTYLNGDGTSPRRSGIGSASAYLGAPYGIYPTADGFLSLAMNSLTKIGDLIDLPELAAYDNPDRMFRDRDEIKSIIAARLSTDSTAHWLSILEPADIWCAQVMDWPTMVEHEGFRALNMVQEVVTSSGATMRTTRCPIRIDGQILTSPKGAPRVGQDTQQILSNYGV